jgi:hypothetical protein
VGDHLRDQETQTGGCQPREAGDLPAVWAARPVEEPQREGRYDEQRNRPESDEILDLVADERVAP